MPVDTVPLVVALTLGMVVLAAVIAGITTMARFVFRLGTIPGVVVHEFAHKQACDLVGVAVVDVAYFRFGDPAGYVRHEQPDRYRESFIISVAPFLVNTVVSLAAFFGLAVLLTADGANPLSPSELLGVIQAVSSETLALLLALAWLGFSIGTQAFPSTGDANSLWSRSITEWRRSPLVLLGIPVVLVIYVVNLLSRLWADVFYALALGIAAFYVVGTVGL